MDDKGEEPAKLVGAAALADVMHLLAGPFYIIDEAGHFILWNRQVEQITGLLPGQLNNIHMLELVTAADRPKVAEAFCTAMQQDGQVQVNACLLLKGHSVPFALWGTRMRAKNRNYLCGMGMDLSSQAQQSADLDLFKRALDAASNGIVITRCEGRDNPIEYVNPAFERISGYSAEESIGRDSRFMAAPGLDAPQRSELQRAILQQRTATVVFRNRRKNGEQFWNQLTVTPVGNSSGKVNHFVGILEDITELKERTTRLEHQVTHDALIGLANRTLLSDRLDHALHSAERARQQVALVLMDLNKFKEINDTMGHDAGDEVLRQVAARLLSAVRETDTVARLGGDEFVLVLAEQPSLRFVLRSLDRVRQALAEPLTVCGRRLSVGASMGVALFPQDGQDQSQLLKAADAAMYAGKSGGLDAIHFYSNEIAASSEARLHFEKMLKRALDGDEIFLAYQPKVCVQTGALQGLEALLRWSHPERGELLPAEFLPEAEENGLIIPLGRRVLEDVFQTLSRLDEMGYRQIPISVNSCSREFNQRDYLPHIAQRLKHYGTAPGRLMLELREAQFMRNPDEARRLAHGADELGLDLALDEFGGGPSNWSCLAALPIAHLKMAQHSIEHIGSEGGNGALARSILDLGHHLDIDVTATCVENDAQRTFLAVHGCASMQGHFVSAPLTRPELEHWLHGGR